jgi:HK97 family phage prohead protease
MSAEQMRAVHEAANRAKTPAKPYGDVTYADPGYQKDGVKRYPIDTAAHCKAAWSYINQASNAAKYSSENLAKIKARIRGAAKKFGIQIADSQSNSAGLLAIDVVRDVYLPQEWRSADGGSDLGLMSGHFSVFDAWYPVESKFEGRFLERVDRSAFDQTIADDRDQMRVLFDHGFDPQIGNKVLGPIQTLEPDTRGAFYEVPLFDTTYNRDLLPGLKAGVYGASMRMRVHEDKWDDNPAPSADNPDGITERTILRAGVMEFGAVTFPASPGASANVRSATDRFYDQLRQRDTATYEAAVRAIQAVTPDFAGASEARSPGRSERDTPTYRQRRDDGALRMRGILT